MQRGNIIQDLKHHQLMVAVRTRTPEDAFQAAAACVEGGVKFIEITFSVPGADDVIRRLAKDERVTVGAGTILTVEDAKKALKAGAKYLVSPSFEEVVVKFAKKEGVVSIPGAATPTEIYRAYTAGGDIIKLFPYVELGGHSFLKAIRGPFPHIPCMLCGGANLENFSGYLEMNAAAILIGAAILKKDLVAAKDWKAIGGLAGKFVAKVDEFRKKT